VWYWCLYIAGCFLLEHLNILLLNKIMSHFNFHVLLLHTLYIYSYKFWKVLIVLSNVILSIFIYSPCYVANCPVYTRTKFKYINCITNCSKVSFVYSPHITLSCIYTYRLWNILNIILTVTLPHIYIYFFSPYSVTTYPVYTPTDIEIY
jgi:hypothetical protein